MSSAISTGYSAFMTAKIVYTVTDEAPALATLSFLPIVAAFANAAGVEIESRDISLAGRIIAAFPDRLTDDQKQRDALAELGELAKTPDANIIKLPNISASIPQLVAAIAELQSQGYEILDFPDQPGSDTEKQIKARYENVLGSAVNPVLREGNSDRRVAVPVKQYAQKHPHSMGAWSGNSKSHVAHMSDGDFYSSEQSTVIESAGNVRIELVDCAGETTILKDSTPVQADEIIDAAVMSRDSLRAFYAEEIDAANTQGVLLSLHLKATMMKVSDPIMFGHAVTVYYKDVFEKFGSRFEELGVEANNGIGDVVGDFYSSEQSAVIESAGNVRIELVDCAGETTILKDSTPVQADEIIDAAVMSRDSLRAFYAEEIDAANTQGVLLSLHLKATMMKVSDPIMFGHAVTVYYKDVFEKFGSRFEELGVEANNGIGDVYAKIASLPDAERSEIESAIEAVYESRPKLAMVDSDNGKIRIAFRGTRCRSQQRHRRRLRQDCKPPGC